MNEVELKSKGPSMAKESIIAKIMRILDEVADALSYKLVDDGDFVFFVKKEDSLCHVVTHMHTIYDGSFHWPAYEKLLDHDVLSREFFYDGKANPFYGCKSLEEVEVLLDLLGRER